MLGDIVVVGIVVAGFLGASQLPSDRHDRELREYYRSEYRECQERNHHNMLFYGMY